MGFGWLLQTDDYALNDNNRKHECPHYYSENSLGVLCDSGGSMLCIPQPFKGQHHQ